MLKISQEFLFSSFTNRGNEGEIEMLLIATSHYLQHTNLCIRSGSFSSLCMGSSVRMDAILLMIYSKMMKTELVQITISWSFV